MPADLEACEWHAPNGVVIRYRWSTPENPEPGRLHPLVLFLHGAGERGNDNVAQLLHGVPDIVKWSRENEPSFLLAPQCPAGKWWAPVNLETMTPSALDEPNARLGALVGLVDELLGEHPVDPDRLYLTGISMGGFGTWSLLTRYPEKFAAAAPVCGGGDPEYAPRFKHVPIWVFHGAKDEVVPVLRSREMVDALRDAGASPRFTVHPDAGHDSWTPTYRDGEFLSWLFAQRRA